MSKIKLGVSLFSLTREYATGELSLEGCIAAVKEMGGQGFELVGTQMLDSYPYASDKVAGDFRAICRNYDIQPVCYGANNDRGMLAHRDLTPQEMLEMAINDIKTAYKLGFSVLRCQYLLSPNVMAQLAPYAEAYGIKVGVELHNPETPSTPVAQAYMEAFDKAGSPYLGFVPDFGCFATKPNKPHWDEALRKGADPAMLELAAQLRYDGVPLQEAMERLAQAGADPAVLGAAAGMFGFVTFYKQPDLEGLKRIMPYCIHFHGKFHYLHEDGREASIPYDEVLPVIAQSDYQGYIMSEYEGQSAGDALVKVKQHLEMERSLLKA